MFSACSNDEAITDGSDNNAEQTLVLQVASTGDNLTTRAGRPLLSSEAKQAIDNVKVIICQGTGNGNVKYVQTLTQWSAETDASSEPYGGVTGVHGREAIIKLADGDKLTTGDYTVYAFGYSDNSDYSDLATKITGITKGGDFSENVTLTLNQAAGNKIGEEIFAGSCALKVEEGKGFYTPVVLNRQVAGTMAYLTDIPCVAGGTKLQLVASDRNTNLVLGHFANHDLDGNGTAADADVNYVVNGTATAADKVIYETALSDWFTDPALDADKNGLIDVDNSNWKGDAAKYANGSVFAGNFVIPFAKTSGNTFTLQLVDNSNNPLKSWIVKLPAGDGQVASTYTSYIWNSNNTSFTENATAQDAADIFNVVRNHLYSIGTRTLDEPTKPGEGPDDKPESLVNKQELVLKVNDNWEVIHNMELE